MAYVDEFGNTVACVTTNAMRLDGLLGSWYWIVFPLLFFIAGYFVLNHYLKEKKILIYYVIIALLIMAWWIIKLWFGIGCE